MNRGVSCTTPKAAGGVVAVKLAQMIAEDPTVSREYRELLGSLRDANEAVGTIVHRPFFFLIARALQRKVALLFLWRH